MTRRWPATLRIVLRGLPSDQRYVAFVSVLGEGNPLVVGPMISDEQGAIVIRREELERELQELRREFPMDYRAASLDLPKSVALDVQSRGSLARRARALQPYYPERAQVMQEISQRDLFFPSVERRMSFVIAEGARELIAAWHGE